MKKSISLAMALLMALSFASCSETPHTHEFSSAWEKDATHHWHAATCEHTEEKGSYAEHKDVNNDGVCDDCQYTDSAHVHTYASQWSANATHHWHATDCGHSLVDGKAEHTVDPFGKCDVCGATIATPDVSTVEKAIALGVIAGDKVNSGKIEQRTKALGEYGYQDEVITQINYEVAQDYAHITKTEWDDNNSVYSTTQNWYTKFEANGEEKVFGVKYNDWSSWTIVRDNEEMIVGMEEGYAFEILDRYYGVEKLVSGLYALGAEEANNQMLEMAKDGIYGFSFEYVATNIYQINVDFEIGAEYNFKNVAVSVERWYAPETTGEGEDVVYSIPQVEVEKGVFEDADADMVSLYVIEQVTGESITPQNTPDMLLADSFKLMNGTEEVTEDTVIEVVAGEEKSLAMAEILPETAMLKLDTIEVTAVDEDGNSLEVSVLSASANTYSGEITLTAKGAFENAVVTVKSNKVVKTFKLTATRPPVESIVASNSMYGYTTITTAEMYLGKTYSFYAVTAPKYADSAYTASIKSKPQESTTVSLVFEQSSGKEVFTPDVLGTYVIELVSVADNTFTAELTINVVSKPDLTKKFIGQYSAGREGMNYLLVTFKPNTDDNGQVTGTIVANYAGYIGQNPCELTETLTYSYNATDDTITLTHESGAENVLNSITFDDNFNMKAVYAQMGQQGMLAVYTPPQPIDEIAGEYTWFESYEGEKRPAGNIRYKLTLNSDGTATLEKGAWNPTGGAYGWGAYNVEESVSFKVTVTMNGEDYVIDVTEITDGSMTDFTVDTVLAYSVTEITDDRGTYDAYIITVGLNGTSIAMMR